MSKKLKKSHKTESAELSEKSEKSARPALFEDPVKRKRILLTLIAAGMIIGAMLLIVLFIANFAGKNPEQVWGTALCRFFFGIFSWGALSLPLLTLYSAYFLPKVVEKKTHIWNLILAASISLSITLLIGVIMVKPGKTDMNIAAVWKSSAAPVPTGAGIIGTYLGWLLIKAITKVGALILVIASMIVQTVFLVGLTLDDVWDFFKRTAKKLWAKIKELFSKNSQKEKRDKPARVQPDDGDGEFIPPVQPQPGTRYDHKPPADVNPYADESARGAKPVKQKTDVNPYVDDDDDEKDQNGISAIPAPVVIPRPGTPEGWGKGGQAGSAERSGKAAGSGDRIKQKGVASDGSIDLDEIFSDDPGEDEPSPFIDVLSDVDEDAPKKGAKSAVRQQSTAPGKKAEQKKIYFYPPITLLTAIPAKQADASEEQATKARKLVETLRAFKVGTKVINISRGPTITRYELQPEEGVRVKQIANLVDDISLSLATAGVRIEAPIPGKPAVGVEVPNQNRETVYLRTLIENSRFEQSQAKLTAAVGVDVAGDPVYVDLAKMPHLLIAGTTGSGKSVCLNCLILSVLYKATPDEVKLIMIDPKKVEFNVYNGLPHLIIPVVSNVKKAAGALSWAVSEMERRYELIEQVGVRDIKSYNKATASDPEREFMPQLLIIIDELADLMMTAPGEVEESICRIAQKGRAAGMHLIIGTQRPSVDVITGLIKANIPSRVAFTVSSQVDSRTIIDIAGAEKLIGRGDMLFAPVGAMKPARLQGAFVSDEEVEAVTTFIIEHSEEAVYDDQVMKDIEREAALCGNKGKKPADPEVEGDLGGEDGEADPMLKPAIDLAVESGKISTSLIQRRLSLGYGRAAKLIDEMEKRGIVSPPEGQKPRTVLISAAEWNEMCMRAPEGEQ